MDIRNNGSVIRRGHVLRILLFIYDAVVVNAAYLTALVLRFSDADSMHDSGVRYLKMFSEFAPCYTVACVILFLAFRLYSVVWRYAGFNDVKKLAIVNAITCALYVGGSLLIVGRMPVSVYILGAGFQFVFMSIARMAPRYILETYGESKSVSGDELKVPLMIVGLGENARIIQNKIIRDKTNVIQPVCVVDYAYGYQGNTFNGLPVYSGPNAVKDCIDKYDIRCIIIADSNMPAEFLESIHDICDDRGIELRDFVIGTEYRSLDVRLRELVSRTMGSVCVDVAGENEKHFPNGKEVANSFDGNNVIDKLSVRNGELVIHIHKSNVVHDGSNDDWINKYREETGSDISFF